MMYIFRLLELLSSRLGYNAQWQDSPAVEFQAANSSIEQQAREFIEQVNLLNP